MDKRVIASMLGMISPESMAVAQALGTGYGRKAAFGQYVVKQKEGNLLDRSENINYDRSKYIPGNGPDHRLGKANPECAKR